VELRDVFRDRGQFLHVMQDMERSQTAVMIIPARTGRHVHNPTRTPRFFPTVDAPPES
jgi:hypothetical protein